MMADFHRFTRGSDRALPFPIPATRNRLVRLAARFGQLSCLLMTAAGLVGVTAAAQSTPDFGPNVYILDPAAGDTANQATLQSLSQEAQFSTNRYAVLMKPGTYNVVSQVGYYESVSGLGETPGAVTINGSVTSSNVDQYGALTTIFWRSLENLTENTPGTLNWGVSQGAPFRRIQVNGSLELTNTNCNYSSGGFIADSRVNGNVNSCSQQQWFTRNSQIGSWSGSVWNMVFAGVQGAPFANYPTNAYTVLPTTPVSREKPFLYIDGGGNYNVFVPMPKVNSTRISWTNGIGQGHSLPISDFFIAKPTNTVADINAALASGKNLILTPGIYALTGPIQVTNPDTIVLGMGYATLVPQNGTPAITVADVGGVQIASVLIDAGPVNSPVLVQLGHPTGLRVRHVSDPSTLSDVFFRIGGATAGLATTTLEVDSDDVILDNLWAWRADHGNGVGWTTNTAAHGVVVNGDYVTALGLAVEHYQQSQVVWNGNFGKTIFYQSELPYDPPSQSAWMDGTANGYPSYEVGPKVFAHAAYGVGVYSFFNQNVNIVDDTAIRVPDAAGVSVTDAVSVFITGSGSITHVVNGAGASVMNGVQTSFLPFYEGVPCSANCPVAPTTPQNLKAGLFTTGVIGLSWSPSVGANLRYSVFRSLDPNFTPAAGDQIASGISGPSYLDANPNPGTYYYAVIAVSNTGVSGASNIASAAIPSTGGAILQDVIAINAGGGAVANWVADEDYSGGTGAGTGSYINTSLVPNAAPEGVYQSNRYGPMTYTISGLIPVRRYIVDLHFAETYWTQPGQRQFNVLINGRQVLKNFDIVAASGGINIAVVESFGAASDKTGTITIQFTVGAADNPQINGIEIGLPCRTNCPVSPTAPGGLTATAVNPNQVNLAWSASATFGVTYAIFRSQTAGFEPSAANEVASGVTGLTYSDTFANPASTYSYAVAAVNAAGVSPVSNFATATTATAGGTITAPILQIDAGGGVVGSWVADEDFSGGTATGTGHLIDTSHVVDPAPEVVYQSNRYGPMTYTLPGLSPGAQYIVNLHFAETYWTQPGQRLFNVSINGNTVLRNYDMIAASGGIYIATMQSFVAKADNSGNITIQFTVGSADNPQINGIEVGVGTAAAGAGAAQ